MALDIDDCLDLAIQSGFSNNGEMFCAFDMATLAQRVGNCSKAAVISANNNVVPLLEHGDYVLWPYNKDGNHSPRVSPCARYSPHWALLVGLLKKHGETYVIAQHGLSRRPVIAPVLQWISSNQSLNGMVITRPGLLIHGGGPRLAQLAVHISFTKFD